MHNFLITIKSRDMNDEALVPSLASSVAALGGFLEGLSFLNRDRRSNFAEAFTVIASDDAAVLAEIQSIFSHLPELTLNFDEHFHGGFRQLEQDIKSLLLVEPHVTDEQRAQDMRSYLSFKIMDRLDDIAELKEFAEPKRIVGAAGEAEGAMIFYLFQTSQISFVLYFFSTVRSQGA